MKIEQRTYLSETGWTSDEQNIGTQLVLVFGERDLLENASRFDELRHYYPSATLLMGSTSGSILNDEVVDDQLVATALAFDSTTVSAQQVNVCDYEGSYQAGLALAEKLPKEGLVHIFILSDGHLVNGTEVVDAFNEIFEGKLPFTGGLAGDGTRFEKTLVGLDQAPAEGTIAAIGFYGDSIQVGYGTEGGWEPFGPERKITKAENNVLYEMSGQSALELYKEYLGDYAKELPGASLNFPLSITDSDGTKIIRTILAIDEEKQSMTFAGDMPVGAMAQLMRSTTDDLTDGAEDAAEQCSQQSGEAPELVICVSCVGRRIVMGSFVDDEMDVVREKMGGAATITGFYSYGEIAPFAKSMDCKLHNQTMTITTFKES